MATPAFGKTIARPPLTFFESYPIAGGHAQHFKDKARDYEAYRVGLQNEAHGLSVENGNDERLIAAIELAEAGGRRFRMVKNKEGEGVKEYLPSETVAVRERIAQRKLRIEEVSTLVKSKPRGRFVEIEEGAFEAERANVPFRELDINEFATEESVADLIARLGAEIKTENEIKFADLTDAEIVQNLTREYNRIKAEGEFDFAGFRLGGHEDYQHGNFQLGPRPTFFELPKKQIFADHGLEVTGNVDGKPMDASVNGNIICYVDNSFAFNAWLDDDDSTLKRIIAKALKTNTGKRQISLADRPGLLRDQAANVLTARRYLEYACRRDEDKGIAVKRPPTVWTVLCWLERTEQAPKLSIVESETDTPLLPTPKPRRMVNPSDETPGDEGDPDFG